MIEREMRPCGFRRCNESFVAKGIRRFCCVTCQQAEAAARYRDCNPKANAEAVKKYQLGIGDRNPGRLAMN